MKMIGIDLKLAFKTNEQATEFLKFLEYLEWCGNVGHSAGITVNADGDGSFMFKAMMKDPKDNQMKSIREILKKIITSEGTSEGRYWDSKCKEYHDWKEEQRADGIPEENIDRNEISFELE